MTFVRFLPLGLLAAFGAAAQTVSTAGNDIPKVFTAPADSQDFIRREVMIPMRDGVKLFTVIVVPKGARNAPILLTRTPYDAAKRTLRNDSTHMLAILPQGDEFTTQIEAAVRQICIGPGNDQSVWQQIARMLAKRRLGDDLAPACAHDG